MALTPEQIRQMYAGNGPMAMPAYTMDDIYGGILPSMGGGNSALNAINAATPTAPMAPASWMAYEGVPVASSVGGAAMPPVPRARPANAPTRLDMAAINAPMAAAQPVTRVSGQMQPESSGGLLDLLLGKSKNGMPGLLGLLGGPQQGGLLQMLLSGARKPAAAAPGAQRPMTSAQRYAAANSGPGSVAAMELLHSGASRNPQSGGPASGGEYASGGR